RPAVQAPVDDQPAADPGSDRQHGGVPRPLRDAESVLSEEGDVGVVVDQHRQPEPLGHEVADRHVRELEVDGHDREPAGAVDRTPPPVNSGGQGQRPQRPDYKVYRSRPGLLSRLRSPNLSKLRERTRKQPDRRGPGKPKAPPKERSPWRRVLKWVGIAALAWI